MHPDEVHSDAALVRRLLEAQFPQWAGLPIERVASAGTENAIYRLGDDLAARLPLLEGTAHTLEKAHRWLPRLAPHLPLDVPTPLAMGEPSDEFPLPWSVSGWLPGEPVTLERLGDPVEAARRLGAFVAALWDIDARDGPPGGAQNYFRGIPLAPRDRQTRACIASLEGLIDTAAATRAWKESLAAPVYDGPPRWIHGDLIRTNLLQVDGRLSAVLDFGCLGTGDPACDLQPAWSLFTGASRAAFRETVAVDDATWLRGRGWALSVAVVALPYYLDRNPDLAAISRFAIDQVLAGATR